MTARPLLHHPLRGRRLLLVEDDFLIALGMTETLEDAGATVVVTVGRVDEALDYIAVNEGAFDSAVLDLNLLGQWSYPIADALLRRGIAFVFTTGYAADVIDPAYRAHPRCEKPVDGARLVATLASLGG